MRPLVTAVLLLSAFVVPNARSQENIINRQNRTVEVVVTESVRVEPDLANVTIGCMTYGETHDQAYETNLQTADKVIKVLLGSGVNKEEIESNAIELSENSADDESRPRMVSKDRRFEAHQSWTIRLAASQAQKIIDIAVRAGANGIESVSWDVSDPEALESKTRGAAMKKARATASEIAESAGTKLGELLYASNVVNGIVGLLAGRTMAQTESASIGPAGAPKFSLKLFPQKIEKQVTVRAVFALD